MARSRKSSRPRQRSKTSLPGAKVNRRLTGQTRKLLGKHYANRYHTRRG